MTYVNGEVSPGRIQWYVGVLREQAVLCFSRFVFNALFARTGVVALPEQRH
jgi:hypothetical protein